MKIGISTRLDLCGSSEARVKVAKAHLAHYAKIAGDALLQVVGNCGADEEAATEAGWDYLPHGGTPGAQRNASIASLIEAGADAILLAFPDRMASKRLYQLIAEALASGFDSVVTSGLYMLNQDTGDFCRFGLGMDAAVSAALLARSGPICAEAGHNYMQQSGGAIRSAATRTKIITTTEGAPHLSVKTADSEHPPDLYFGRLPCAEADLKAIQKHFPLMFGTPKRRRAKKV